MIAANFAANALPINNLTTAQISDRFPNLFTPTGFTFAIWGVIYLLLLCFCIYQARDVFRSHPIDMPFVHRIGWTFFISSLLNTAWIFAWHHLWIGTSMIIMVLLLLSLIAIYHRLGIGQRQVPTGENLWVQLPFRIYLGWITVATIANAVVLSVYLGWDRWGWAESTWVIILITAATLITLAFLRFRRDVAFSFVVLWALFGILYERLTTEPEVMAIVFAALIAMFVIVAFGTWAVTRPKRRRLRY